VGDLVVRPYLKKKRSKSIIKIYCLIFILVLSCLGVGYGVFSEGAHLVGKVYTGNIDPVFLKDIQVYIHGQGQVSAHLKGEHTIVISVQNAHTDDIYHIRYKIANKGSIPVSFKAITSESDPGIALRIEKPTGIIKGHGDTTEGEITIEVGEVSPDSTYECSVSFSISQWNTID
jgi:hypothetical protein